jgi:phage tail protein X
MERTYTTVQGDMWDAVSFKVYGDEKYMGILMQGNLDLLDIFIFPTDTVLTVPELDAEIDSNIPSWR